MITTRVTDGSGSERSGALHRAGETSWAAIGIIILASLIATGVGALSGILVPLTVAGILGIVLEPFVARLERHRVPAALAAVIGLLTTILVFGVLVYLVVAGFMQQLPEISRQLLAGWDGMVQWARELDLDVTLIDRLREMVYSYGPVVGQGVVGAIAGTITGGISFIMGLLFSLFFLFFVLRDFRLFGAWISRTTGANPELVRMIKDISRESIQGYFRGTALSALITAPIFLLPLILLRVPLVIPIAILYFFFSFIPFLGPWITGAFAVLIAFGATGPMGALIVAVSLMLSNGTIQNVVNSWALGTSLSLHPTMVLLSTIAGGVIAGLLGMVLGPPVAAVIRKSVLAIREYRNPLPIEPEPLQVQ